ncbi:MAG: ABC transporter permease [Actinomycetota bacterium]|nr:ABC transporter permease [Actinomycetota bacterium]
MWKISLKSLRAHKRRLLRTCSAVLLGVAFLAGTLVLGDTMRAGFANVFSEAYAGTDVVVQGAQTIGSESGEQRRIVPDEVLTTIEGAEGVDVVVPAIDGLAQVLDSDGDAIGGNGPPTLGGAWDATDMNPYDLVDGRAPETSGEVVIDRGTARKGELGVGDTTRVRTPTPVDVTIVGIAAFGSQDSIGGSGFTGFTPEDARQHLLFGAPGSTSVSISAEQGVTPDELAERIGATLPEGFEAKTGEQMSAAATESIGEDFLDMMQTFLLAFTVIALLVSTFSIYNTFSVILAQRTRESALFRAIGATRSQVLNSIAIEALLIGLIASIGGVLVGLALALGLTSGMRSIGIDLPGGLDVSPTSLVISVVVGLVVTLLASLAPAVRASRVAPMAALRDAAIDRSDTSRVRAVLGAVVAVAGIGLVLYGALGSVASPISIVGPGALLSLVGLVVLGPVVARPASSLLGAPIAATRGASGSLARGNAMRNPQRTAGTASALMIGVSVVALFTVVAASLTVSFRETITGSLTSDLIVVDESFSGSGMSPEMSTRLTALPEVDDAVGLGFGSVLDEGEELEFAVVDLGRLDRVADLEVTSGGLAELGRNGIAVASDAAEEHGWKLGSEVPVTFIDGAEEPLRVGALFDKAEITGSLLMSQELWTAHNSVALDFMNLIALAPGVDVEEGRAAVDAVGEEFGAPGAVTSDEYADDVAGQITQMLSIVYVLLALSIIIALMGISNTLALSIHERTRELGLLRAIGQTRGQLRSMVRWESVIIAVFGTVGGIGLGLFLAWGLVRGLSTDFEGASFSAPVTQLVVITAVGGLAGVLAGILPARRAARLDVLGAISEE